MNTISYVDAYNLIQILNKNAHFRKTTLCTSVLKKGHNFACDQYFFMKLAPLCLVDTELLIHTKNP